MSSQPISASSLNRYKPVILTIAGLAAAYSCYLAFTTHQLRHTAPIRRSGAIHQRRRRNHRSQSQTERTRAINQENYDTAGRAWYGSQTITLPSGEEAIIELHLPDIPTADQLRRNGLQPLVAERTRRALEIVYITRWILGNLQMTIDSLADGEYSADDLAAVTEVFEDFGFSMAVITEGIRQFRIAWGRHRRNGDAVWENTQIVLDELLRDADTDTVAGTEVDEGENGTNPGAESSRDGQGLKQMLYYIAEQQSRDDSYIHRGVECNSCDIKPIRGVRWRCINCPDYDLCSDCEAVGMHDKTHIFLKVKIPAPYLGNPRQTQSVIYPGKPFLMGRGLSADVRHRLNKETKFDAHELDALYDQFTCLANVEWPSDPNKISAAIDRTAFDKAFVPLASYQSPKPNLIYDRMFSFYDTNHDGLIGFEEFVKGLACLQWKEKDSTRLRRVFDGYDLDSDGYVCRKDFLRMFRSYYSIKKEIVHDLLAVQEAERESMHNGSLDIIQSSQPLSASFSEHIYSDPARRHVPLKSANSSGETRTSPPLREDTKDTGNREEILGHGWQMRQGHHFDLRSGDPIAFTNGQSDLYDDRPVEELRREVVEDRWRRRQFYTDEEEGFGFGQTPRNSDFAISELEWQYGQEILYQVTEQGLNELLDPLFRSVENDAILVEQSAGERKKWRRNIDEWQASLEEAKSNKKPIDPLFATASAVEEQNQRRPTSVAKEELFDNPVNEAVESVEKRVQEASLSALLEDLGAAVDGGASDAAMMIENGQPLRSNHDHAVQGQTRRTTTSQATRSGAPSPDSSDTGYPRNAPPNRSQGQPVISNFFQRNGRSVQATSTAGSADVDHRDPTLPHHRPSSVEVQSAPTNVDIRINDASVPSPPQTELLEQIMLSIDSAQQGAAFSFNPRAALQVQEERKKPAFAAEELNADGRPTEVYLKKLADLDQVEKSIGRRGAPGLLSWSEFSRFMRGSEGRSLGFVEEWLELGSF